jgi:hypothetical protein
MTIRRPAAQAARNHQLERAYHAKRTIARDQRSDTCLSFYRLTPVEGSGPAAHPIDGVQTPPISLISNELGSESQAGVNVGSPSITNFEPRRGGKHIRSWLESLASLGSVA